MAEPGSDTYAPSSAAPPVAPTGEPPLSTG